MLEPIKNFDELKKIWNLLKSRGYYEEYKDYEEYRKGRNTNSRSIPAKKMDILHISKRENTKIKKSKPLARNKRRGK